MNSKGETIITPQYKDGYQFTEGLAAVQVLNKGLRDSPKWGYIDINGNLVIESKYSSASTFRESKAIVEFREMKGEMMANLVLLSLPLSSINQVKL